MKPPAASMDADVENQIKTVVSQGAYNPVCSFAKTFRHPHASQDSNPRLGPRAKGLSCGFRVSDFGVELKNWEYADLMFRFQCSIELCDAEAHMLKTRP